MKKLRIAGILNDSVVDGPGIRLAIFTQGCKHHCKNCHNPETWSFEGGKEIDEEEIIKTIKNNPLLQGITLSGGDPIFQAGECTEFITKIKSKFPQLDIILYTGFTFEELLQKSMVDKNIEVLLGFLDIIVDGKYEDDKRDLTLRFRGSTNQRIINVKKSLQNSTIFEEKW